MRTPSRRLTVDPQQKEDCINYMPFGAAQSLDADHRSVTLTSAKTIRKRRVEHNDNKNEMEKERETLMRLTVDPQQTNDCINYMGFGAAESLS